MGGVPTLPRGSAESSSALGAGRVHPHSPERQRLLWALTEVVHDIGFDSTTATAIAGRAEVDRDAFDRSFECVESCFIEAFEEEARSLGQCLGAALEPHQDWQLALDAAIAAGLSWLAARPARAHLCVVAPLQAGQPARRDQQALIELLARGLRRELERRAGVESTSALAYEMFLGAVREVLRQALAESSSADLRGLAPRLQNLAWIIDLQFPLDG